MTKPFPSNAGEHDVLDPEFDVRLHSLELALTELPSARQTAVLIADLPEYGEVLLVAFVPAGTEHEQATQRVARAACARLVPTLPALVIPVEDIPYTLDGDLRAQALFDGMLPQIARDLMLPKEMSA